MSSNSRLVAIVSVSVSESLSARAPELGSAEQYRAKAQNYRAWAATEEDQNRRKALEILADTFANLAADYERADSIMRL